MAFVVLSGVGALMEERGLTKGILNNPDMRPQMEMKTRFADVKGVDEAKVCIHIAPLTELTKPNPCLCTLVHTGISSSVPCHLLPWELLRSGWYPGEPPLHHSHTTSVKSC